MTVKAEAFLALESALSKRLRGSLQALVAPVYKAVQSAIDASDYDEAERAIRALRLSDVYERNKAYIAYLTNLTMLFGASRVTRNPGTTVVGLGFEKDTAFQINQTFSQMIGRSAEMYLIAQGVQLIAQLRSGPVSKADPTPTPTTAPRRILRDFQTFMAESGDSYLDISSSLHTSRVSAFGFTAEAMALGLTEYQINEQLDRRICPVCAIMHSQKFKVRDARTILNVVTRVSDPEELKTLQPWPKRTKDALKELGSLTTEELVSRNWHIPPFHPKCRGLLARVGKVPELTAGGTVKPDEKDYKATRDDFETLLLKAPSKEGLKHWNDKVRLPPSSVAATMLASTADALLTKALTDKVAAAIRVKTSAKFVQVKATRNMGVGKLEHTVRFDGGSVEVSIATLPTGMVWKDYLIGLYLMAQDSGATRLVIGAVGAELSDLGFSLSDGKWVLDLTNKGAMATFLG